MSQLSFINKVFSVKRPTEDTSEQEKKKARLDDEQLKFDKERLARKLDAPKVGSVIPDQVKSVFY